jgi:D-alanine-D-alanine ligase
MRILILFGGRSAEHEVSLISARSVYGALDRDRYAPVLVGIGRDGRWFFGGEDGAMLRANEVSRQESTVVCLGNKQGILTASDGTHIEDGEFDVVFPLLHGPYGEDGSVQGLLELVGSPYVGAGVAASAVGMDKELSKAVFSAAGLLQTKYTVIRGSKLTSHPNEVVGEVEGNFDYPVFVKPANLGSSVGISKVRTRDQLIDGLNCAGSYDTKIIVEASVEGAREIECAVLGDEHPEVSGVGEIIPGAEFYDYRTKYFNDCAKLVIPAELPKKTTKQIQDMSLRAFQAINCSGLARVDFFIRPNGEVMLNEINTMPGFTPISMYPKLWEETGLHYPQLIDRLIQLGLERHASRGALKTTLQP